MFTNAIVKRPCREMINGIRTEKEQVPVFSEAVRQHDNYIKALEKCGLDVIVLEGDEKYPDSTFIEDTAVLIPYCGIISNSGADSRKGEISAVKNIIGKYFNTLENIIAPGTLEGGDIMMTDDHCFIGITKRTNLEGAEQLKRILKRYDIDTTFIPVRNYLHLKTGINYIGDNTMIGTEELIKHKAFNRYKKIIISEDEAYSANCLRVNEKVLVPFGFQNTLSGLRSEGFDTIVIDLSEFAKLDGGLTCLSLRF